MNDLIIAAFFRFQPTDYYRGLKITILNHTRYP